MDGLEISVNFPTTLRALHSSKEVRNWSISVPPSFHWLDFPKAKSGYRSVESLHPRGPIRAVERLISDLYKSTSSCESFFPEIVRRIDFLFATPNAQTKSANINLGISMHRTGQCPTNTPRPRYRPDPSCVMCLANYAGPFPVSVTLC